MNPDDLARILDELGQRLGPTGEYVFALAVRQTVINGILWLVSGIVLLIVPVVVTVVIYRVRRGGWERWNALPDREKQYPSLNDRPGIEYVAVAGFTWFVCGALAAMLIGSAVSALLNPEYAALRDILGAIGGKR